MVNLIDINKEKKKSKTRYILNVVFISLLLLMTIAGAILLILLSPLDYLLNLIIDIVLTCVVIVFTIFYFLNIFPIVRHYYMFYKNMNEISLERRRRVIFNNKEEITTKENVKYQSLKFFYQEQQKNYTEYLYLLDSDCPFVSGQAYKVVTYQNVIIRYEVIDDAKI